MTEAESMEFYTWQDRLYEIEHLKYGITEDDKDAIIRANDGDILQPTYDRVEELFDELESVIKGRLNELDESYCLDDFEARRYYSSYRFEAEQAQSLGINFVALHKEVTHSEMDRVMMYLHDKKLATTSYEGTLKGIEQYRAEELAELRDSIRQKYSMEVI